MVRNPGGSKVEDELDENKGEWDETEPEEEEDGLREEDNQRCNQCCNINMDFISIDAKGSAP